MAKYYIKVVETLQRIIEVEAPDVDTAWQMVDEEVNDDSPHSVLDDSDFDDRELYDVTEQVDFYVDRIFNMNGERIDHK